MLGEACGHTFERWSGWRLNFGLTAVTFNGGLEELVKGFELDFWRVVGKGQGVIIRVRGRVGEKKFKFWWDTEIDGVEINTNYSIDLTSCKISPILPIQVYKLGENYRKNIYKNKTWQSHLPIQIKLTLIARALC